MNGYRAAEILPGSFSQKLKRSCLTSMERSKSALGTRPRGMVFLTLIRAGNAAVFLL